MQAGSSLGYPHEGPYSWSSHQETGDGGGVSADSWFDMGRVMDLLNEAVYEERVKAWFSPSVVAAQGKSAQPSAGSTTSSSNSEAGKIVETSSVHYEGDYKQSHGNATLGDVAVTANRLQKKDDDGNTISLLNNFLFGTAGALYGLGEYGLRSNAPGIIHATRNFIGNEFNVVGAVNGTANILKYSGRGFFIASASISAVQGFNKFQNGDYVGTSKSGLDIGMGAFGTFGGPAGLLISTPYYLIDSFEGWDNAMKSMMEMNSNNQQLINMGIINFSDLYKN